MAPGGGLPLKPLEQTTANEFIISACSRHSTMYPACGDGAGSFALYSNGTSQSAPLVAGAAASVDSLASPPGSATPVQMERRFCDPRMIWVRAARTQLTATGG